MVRDSLGKVVEVGWMTCHLRDKLKVIKKILKVLNKDVFVA